jgi:hypothetical protein
LFVAVREDTGAVILECEECAMAWSTLESSSQGDMGFLAIELPTRLALAEELRANGWLTHDFQLSVD